MTPSPDTLLHAEDGEYIGVYTPGAEEESEQPVAVYKAKFPHDAADIDAYRFHPASVLEGETMIAGPAVVTAAIEHPHKEKDGHTHAEIAVAASGDETAVDQSAVAVFRNPAHFAHVVEAVTGEKPAEVLDMPNKRTNLGPEGTVALGFSATGQPDVLTLELLDNQERVAA